MFDWNKVEIKQQSPQNPSMFPRRSSHCHRCHSCNQKCAISYPNQRQKSRNPHCLIFHELMIILLLRRVMSDLYMLLNFTSDVLTVIGMVAKYLFQQ